MRPCSGPMTGCASWRFSFWLFLTGTFMLFFGTQTFRKAIFPLLLLLLTIPFPGLLLDKIVGFLQTASFAMTGLIFNVLGFFPIEQGFAFKFPEGTIEVATQCSGIRWQHGARYHEPFMRSYFFAVEPQSNSPGLFRSFDRDLQKRGENCGLTLGGLLRDSKYTGRPPAQEWRDSWFSSWVLPCSRSLLW